MSDAQKLSKSNNDHEKYLKDPRILRFRAVCNQVSQSNTVNCAFWAFCPRYFDDWLGSFDILCEMFYLLPTCYCHFCTSDWLTFQRLVRFESSLKGSHPNCTLDKGKVSLGLLLASCFSFEERIFSQNFGTMNLISHGCAGCGKLLCCRTVILTGYCFFFF